jgi:hypothetical protein
MVFSSNSFFTIFFACILCQKKAGLISPADSARLYTLDSSDE